MHPVRFLLLVGQLEFPAGREDCPLVIRSVAFGREPLIVVDLNGDFLLPRADCIGCVVNDFDVDFHQVRHRP